MASIHSILKKHWGYDTFRPLQEDIIKSVLEKKDTLALLPTGGGKSICFQIPALVLEGICIVISPLIALMKDQVEQLQKRGITAKSIYSGMSKTEIDILLDNCIYGNIKFLYISPERLKTELFLARAKKMNITLLAIDEAHCISQWGYDFRPPYLEISEFRKLIPNIPCIALTATATKEVKVDIQEKLHFGTNSNVFTKSFARDNLSYSVFKELNKEKRLIEIISKVQGTAVVYVGSRKRTKEIADLLRRNRINADFYHAGLSHKERSNKQEAWIQNRTRVIVATNAFGMGIDKSDVRLVVHIDLANTLEAYYQEAGRGGRDEKLAFATLLYNDADITQIRTQLENSYPTVEELRRVYQSLANYYKLAAGSGYMASFDFDLADLIATYNLKYIPTFHALKRLEDENFIQLNDVFYAPSKVLFLLRKEKLYEFQVANAELDFVIKALLRKYGGELFSDFMSISEKSLANDLKVSKKKVTDCLRNLHQNKVINYLPQNSKPQLTFITERFIASALPINKKGLEERKKKEQTKIAAVISYVQNESRCRTITLLEYFNEFSDKKCGVCDICLKEKRAKKFIETEVNYSRLVLELFEKEKRSWSIQQVIASVQPSNKEQTITAIKELLNSEELQYNQAGELEKS